jgi:hypothetical protein
MLVSALYQDARPRRRPHGKEIPLFPLTKATLSQRRIQAAYTTLVARWHLGVIPVTQG